MAIPMVKKVVNPQKIVTDELVLKELTRQGIDRDYVEFFQDYAPRALGKEHSPYAKFYRDLKSGKRIMVASGLPMVKVMGRKIEPGWLYAKGKYYSRANLFSAIIDGESVQLTCLSDQPTGVKKGERVTWQPQLFLNGKEVKAKGQTTLLTTDPVNKNYHNNVLEWDYGICKRRIRIIEGRFRERWIFPANPNGDIRIKHGFIGGYRPKLGTVIDARGEPLKAFVVDDEEVIPASEFARSDIVYPIEAGASATYSPDAHVENMSVDGRIGRSADPAENWATLRAGAGTYSDDSGTKWTATFFNNNSCPNWTTIYRAAHLYDSSGLPDDAVISAVTNSIYGLAEGDGNNAGISCNIYSSNPASNTALVNADYGQVGTTAYCDTPKTIATFNIGDPGTPNDFAFNAAGIAAVSKTGITKLSFRITQDAENTAPACVNGQWSYFEVHSADKGAGYKPKLVVTYTAGITIPVAMHHRQQQKVVG